VKNKIVMFLVLFVLSSSAYTGVSNTLYQATIAGCNVTVSHNAVKGRKATIVIRARVNKERCQISRDSIQLILSSAFSKLKQKKHLSEVSSIFLAGKLQTYRWMSRILVARSINNSRWNQKTGRPINGSANSYVNSLLFSDAVIRPFSKPLKKYHYKVTAVSCEKIIINKVKLPYEAMCWLRIKKTGLAQ